MTILAFLWVFWCILHSLLITGRLTAWIRKQGGALQGGYRLFYVIFSCISLVPVLWYQYSLPQQLIFSFSGPWRILQGILLAYALIMFFGGNKVYDSDYFLGLQQWRSYTNQQPSQPVSFACEGILYYVRHPWYSGGLAVLWGLGPLTDVTLPARIILTLYLVIGTLLEEKKLVRELGRPYRDYCRQVPMLFPWRGKVEIDFEKETKNS
jgi:protein-S-isoprenylcysteine O-methyltransferase Ste14